MKIEAVTSSFFVSQELSMLLLSKWEMCISLGCVCFGCAHTHPCWSSCDVTDDDKDAALQTDMVAMAGLLSSIEKMLLNKWQVVGLVIMECQVPLLPVIAWIHSLELRELHNNHATVWILQAGLSVRLKCTPAVICIYPWTHTQAYIWMHANRAMNPHHAHLHTHRQAINNDFAQSSQNECNVF